jgi:hypothetical protein
VSVEGRIKTANDPNFLRQDSQLVAWKPGSRTTQPRFCFWAPSTAPQPSSIGRRYGKAQYTGAIFSLTCQACLQNTQNHPRPAARDLDSRQACTSIDWRLWQSLTLDADFGDHQTVTMAVSWSADLTRRVCSRHWRLTAQIYS